MATDPIVLLRRAIDEPDETTYTTVELTGRLLADGDANITALSIWIEKMAAASGFVNVSEGGSQRAMQQQFDHAKAMVELYTGLAANSSPSSPVLRKLTRV